MVPLKISTIWLICWVLTGVALGAAGWVGVSGVAVTWLPALIVIGGRFNALKMSLKMAWLADCWIFFVKNSKFCLSWILTLLESEWSTWLPFRME